MKKFYVIFTLVLVAQLSSKTRLSVHCSPQGSEGGDPPPAEEEEPPTGETAEEPPGGEAEPEAPATEPPLAIPPAEPEPEPTAPDPVPAPEESPTQPPAAEVDATSPTVDAAPSVCAESTLVSCFMAVLTKWAWHLWSFKENIVTLNSTVCEQHAELTKCVRDLPHCTMRQVLNVSSTLSNLLVHRRESGNILKPYFLTTFACTAEGKKIVDENRECLKREHISRKVQFVSTVLENNIREHALQTLEAEPTTTVEPMSSDVPAVNWYCEHLNSKLNEFYLMIKTECNLYVGYLMCKSLTDAFTNLFPENLENCLTDCSKPPPTTPAPPVGDDATGPAPGDGQTPPVSDGENAGNAGQQNGAPTTDPNTNVADKPSIARLLLISNISLLWALYFNSILCKF